MHGVARSRPASFFVCEAKFAQEPANCVRVCRDAGGICQCTGQFKHCHVAVLFDKFDDKRSMRIKLTLAMRSTLRRGAGPAGSTDRKPPNAPQWWVIALSAIAAARPLNPSSINF